MMLFSQIGAQVKISKYSQQQRTIADTEQLTRNTSEVISFWQNNTHTHSFNGHFSGTTQVSRYQKGKTNLDFTGARDSEWQWHQLGYMQVCTSLQPDNHASTPPLSFLQAGCPSCHPTNSVKALKATSGKITADINCLFCTTAAAVLLRPEDGTVSVIVLFTIVSSCVTD